MLVNMVCPQCGAPLEMNSERQFMFCMHCGSKVMNMAQRYDINQNVQVNSTVVHRIDHTGQPNLHIHFSSINPAVGMVVRFTYNNQKSYFINGQRFSFHLPFGLHNIILKIGKKNYARSLYLPEDNSPANIYATWNGRAHITIDQPYIPPVSRVQQAPVYYTAPMPAAAGTKLCPACGQSLAPNLRFCTRCGTKL